MSFHFRNALRQQRFCFVALLVALLAGVGQLAAAAEEQPVAGRQRETGFTPLFQGDGTEIWKGYGKEGWPEGWKLDGRVLHRHASGGDLMTKKEYGDFDLRFGWKVSPGGNSGVMYRVSEEKEPAYFTGPEYQILDNAKHQDGRQASTSSAALYAMYPPTVDVMKPAGEWNRSQIVVQGNRVRHYLNGEKVVDAELGSDDWNKRLAASKFASWPKFGKNERGHIVLQDHGDEVWYRNIRIKDLAAKPAVDD